MIWLALLTITLLPQTDDLDLLKSRLRSDRSDVRAAAIRRLGEMNRLEATQLLPDLLLDPNAYVRDTCFVTLGKIDDGPAVDYLINEGMRRGESQIKVSLAEWADTTRPPGGAPGLLRLLKDRSPAVRLAAAEALARIGDPSVAADLEKALREKDGGVRARMLLAFARLAPEMASKRVRKGLSHRHWQIRVAAVIAAGNCLEGAEAVEAGRDALRDKAWPVRAAAIELLRDSKNRSAVEPLIAALEMKGRLGEDAYQALMRLTGMDLPPEADLWLRWWALQEDSFRPAESGPKGDSPRKTRTALRYHGVPVVSRRIAFILDRSGSMRDPLEKGGRGTKFEFARKELSRVIDELPEKALFNIYFYSDEVSSWKKRATPAHRQSRLEARSFLDRQRAKGYTNLYGALVAGLDDLEVDTIYLLSDGGPSRGDVIFTERILHRVGRRNRIRRVVIHTIDTGSSRWHQAYLLKELAKGSGGRYFRLHEE
ncbi:MAG: HEAT repeat domain-containing protein [Planctomycetota bacterium]|nr:HEAT repeat domain-containing protein [Planctomycetota bacterium]